MTDIASITPTTRTHEIKDPRTGEPIGIRVQLLPNSDEGVKKIIRQLTDRANQQRLRGKIVTAAELEEYATKLISVQVVAWEWYGDVTFKGEKPEYSAANVAKVCTELAWFRDDIDEAIGDTKRFFTT